MQIETRRLEDLKAATNNSRTHSPQQIEQIAASMEEFGWTNPLLIDENNEIIAGHGRKMAALQRGETEGPCIVLAGLTDAQKRAYLIADNQLPLNAGWDLDTLKVEIEALQDLDFDIDVLGFDSSFLDDLLVDALPPTEDPQAVPDVPEEPTSVPGDIWVLGEHRVMCGDSTLVDAMDELCGGMECDMVFTDPPYGISYGSGRGGEVGSTDGTVKKFGIIKNDELKGDALVELVRDALSNALVFAKPDAATYVCFPWRTHRQFEEAITQAGLEAKACIVWDKKSIGLGTAHYRPQHEFIFYCPGEGGWQGDKAESDVWTVGRDASVAYVHPTQKPVELIERALKNSSPLGGRVLDCFGGSGSTLLACQRTQRVAHIMELDPAYVDVIVRRWQNYTGKRAVHAQTGQPFDYHNSRPTE